MDSPALSSRKSITPKTSVSGCSHWKTRSPSSMMFSQSSTMRSAFIRSRQVLITWMPTSSITSRNAIRASSARSQHAGKRDRRPIIPAIIPGIHSWMAAHGRRGSRQNKILTHQLPTRRRIPASSRSLTFPAISSPAMTAMVRTSGPIRRMCCVA